MFNKKLNKVTVLCIVLSLLHFPLSAQQKTRLIEGWDFCASEIGSYYEAFRVTTKVHLPTWKAVEMPHCFNAYDAVDPDKDYYQGVGWYRTWINVENPYKNGRTILHFEGAGQKTEVYLYDQKLISHVGGYDEFKVDITEAVKAYRTAHPEAEHIPIAVRCDNSRDTEMIPSDLSDFNVYGGLYRYVNLIYQPALALERVVLDYELDKKLKTANITINTELNNFLDENEAAQLQIKLIDANGQEVLSEQKSIETNAKDIISNLELKKPQLWHPNSPYLYRLEVQVTRNGEDHTLSQMVGFRTFEFITKGPFHINGERLLLRGTHRHEDHAGVAQAMTEKMMREEMIMMKDMGVNFIRLGHYQQSPIILNLCDSLGILVWEEIPWCRGGLGGDIYKEQARRMLTHMVHQHYNHPSIIIWGLGNENDWPGDFEEFDTTKIQNFMSELNDLSHQLDPNRKTAIRRCNFCKHIIDVYSPSIWAGWYRGTYTSYQDVSYKEAMDVNHFLHVEWGASNHAGRHSESPDQGLANISNSKEADERSGDFLMSGGDPRVSKDGDWSETYACNLIDWHLKEQENMPWLSGTAYWPFKDFSTPLRPENPVPYVNQKGVVQRDLSPKEAYYVFQSYWTEKEMAHIYGHTWPVRWGQKDEAKMLKVYSNCTQAEVFLNGKSLGVKTRNSQNFPAAGLRWVSPFKEGKNHIKVIAKKGKVEVIDEITFTYQIQNWDAPTQLKLSELSREGSTVLVEAKAYDKNGLFCPDANNLVIFGAAGKAKLLDNLGTWDGSRNIQLYNGRAMMKVQITNTKGVATVRSEGLSPAFLELTQ